MHATTYRPDIAQTIPHGLFSHIKDILSETSRILGRIEAYGALSKTDKFLEKFLKTDLTTVAILGDLLDRFSSVIKAPENDEIIDRAAIEGYRDVLDGKIREISVIRNMARNVIANAWNIEEIVPAIGFDPAVVVSPELEANDPLAEIPVETETEVDDEFTM